MVIYTTVPLMTALLGWGFLGETLSLSQWAGILLTSCGVAMVLTQTNGPEGDGTDSKGVLLALLGSFGQAAGLVRARPVWKR